MKKIFNYIELISLNAAALGGVFTYSDLAAVCNCSDNTLLPRYINQLEEVGVIHKFIRGFYVTKGFDPRILSQKICTQSYLSFETILAQNLVIGTIPMSRISAVKLGRSRKYQANDIEIEHLSTSKKTFIGYFEKNGVKEADSEKALIDTLYFCLKGRKVSFDMYSDLNVSKLNRDKIERYLKSYNNPKFLKFVAGVLDAYE